MSKKKKNNIILFILEFDVSRTSITSTSIQTLHPDLLQEEN